MQVSPVETDILDTDANLQEIPVEDSDAGKLNVHCNNGETSRKARKEISSRRWNTHKVCCAPWPPCRSRSTRTSTEDLQSKVLRLNTRSNSDEVSECSSNTSTWYFHIGTANRCTPMHRMNHVVSCEQTFRCTRFRCLDRAPILDIATNLCKFIKFSTKLRSFLSSLPCARENVIRYLFRCLRCLT